MVDEIGSKYNTPHLSEEDIDNAIVGELPGDVRAHLATCDRCRSQVEAFHSSLQLFNQSSLSWTEAKAARIAGITPSHASSHMKLAFALACSMALLLLAALTITGGLHRWPGVYQAGRSLPAPVSASTAATQDSPSKTEVAQDNELMQAIANEMRPVSSPVLPYESRPMRRQDRNAAPGQVRE